MKNYYFMLHEKKGQTMRIWENEKEKRFGEERAFQPCKMRKIEINYVDIQGDIFSLGFFALLLSFSRLLYFDSNAFSLLLFELMVREDSEKGFWPKKTKTKMGTIVRKGLKVCTKWHELFAKMPSLPTLSQWAILPHSLTKL